MSSTRLKLLVLLALGATIITFGGTSSQGAIMPVASGSLLAEALGGDADVIEVARRCRIIRHRVCPPPCPGGPRVCPKGPRRCYYWSERVC